MSSRITVLCVIVGLLVAVTNTEARAVGSTRRASQQEYQRKQEEGSHVEEQHEESKIKREGYDFGIGDHTFGVKIQHPPAKEVKQSFQETDHGVHIEGHREYSHNEQQPYVEHHHKSSLDHHPNAEHHSSVHAHHPHLEHHSPSHEHHQYIGFQPSQKEDFGEWKGIPIHHSDENVKLESHGNKEQEVQPYYSGGDSLHQGIKHESDDLKLIHEINHGIGDSSYHFQHSLKFDHPKVEEHQGEHEEEHHHEVKTVTVTKEVPVPYTVEVEKKVPYKVEVPVDKPYKVEVPKPYPVYVEKKIPFKVKEYVPQPYTVYKKVPYTVKVHVDKPYPVHVPKPYHVVVEKKVPYHVEKHVPYPVRVYVDKPYPVHVPVYKHVPYTVEKKVPYPVKVPVEKPYPVSVPKPYKVYVEKKVPYTVEKPVPYPVHVPVYHKEKNEHAYFHHEVPQTFHEHVDFKAHGSPHTFHEQASASHEVPQTFNEHLELKSHESFHHGSPPTFHEQVSASHEVEVSHSQGEVAVKEHEVAESRQHESRRDPDLLVNQDLKASTYRPPIPT